MRRHCPPPPQKAGCATHMHPGGGIASTGRGESPKCGGNGAVTEPCRLGAGEAARPAGESSTPAPGSSPRRRTAALAEVVLPVGIARRANRRFGDFVHMRCEAMPDGLLR